MAEKILEKPVCQNCSADVRPGALFCYNCGSQVASPESESSNNNGKISLRLREEIAERENKYSTGKLGFDEKPIEKPSEDPFALPVGKKAEVQEKGLRGERQALLKSAASLRKKNRAAAKKKVEVVWEPAENSPNILFIVASLILLLVAIVILMAMLYLR